MGDSCHDVDMSKGRVLIVDDDTALAEMLGIVLRGEGYEPTLLNGTPVPVIMTATENFLY